jgi:hypothetical protein
MAVTGAFGVNTAGPDQVYDPAETALTDKSIVGVRQVRDPVGVIIGLTGFVPL